MLVQEQLKNLRKYNYDDGTKVFSLYLNTDPKSSNQQKGEWKIHLKNVFKELKQKIEARSDDDEMKQFEKIKDKVEKEIYENEHELQRGYILFATAGGELWFSKTLQIPVETEYHWQAYPVLQQLEKLEESYPYSIILAIQQDEARLLETEVGMLNDESYYTLDLNTEDWREHQGPQGDDLTQGGAKRDEFDDRFAANQYRWLKRLAHMVENKAKDKGWKAIYVVGEKEEIRTLESAFHKKIDKIVSKNLLHRKADRILDEVFDD